MVRETLRSNQGAQAHAAFVTSDPMVAYKHFLHHARALPFDSVKVCTMDVELVHDNIERALTAMEPHFATAQGKLPLLSVPALLELRALALALIYAAERIVLATIDGSHQHRLLRLRYLRDLTLRQLEIFAHLALIPSEHMRVVGVGLGPLESAHSALAIVGVFAHHHEHLQGKHPFTAEQLDELDQHARWLIDAMQPRHEASVSPERDAAVVIRDRFWTLLSHRYDDLREAGAIVFVAKHLDRNVPRLGSRPAPEKFRPGAAPPPTGHD